MYSDEPKILHFDLKYYVDKMSSEYFKIQLYTYIYQDQSTIKMGFVDEEKCFWFSYMKWFL